VPRLAPFSQTFYAGGFKEEDNLIRGMTSNFYNSRGTHLADDSKTAEFKAHVVNRFSGYYSASLLNEVKLDHDSSLVCTASLSEGMGQPVFLYDCPSGCTCGLLKQRLSSSVCKGDLVRRCLT
jgi:hypothetical protein